MTYQCFEVSLPFVSLPLSKQQVLTVRWAQQWDYSRICCLYHPGNNRAQRFTVSSTLFISSIFGFSTRCLINLAQTEFTICSLKLVQAFAFSKQQYLWYCPEEKKVVKAVFVPLCPLACQAPSPAHFSLCSSPESLAFLHPIPVTLLQAWSTLEHHLHLLPAVSCATLILPCFSITGGWSFKDTPQSEPFRDF